MTISQHQTVAESTLEARRDQSTSNRYLPLLITFSILIHEGLLLIFMGNPWLLSKAASSSVEQIPIEFVELDPNQATQDPPLETDNVALQNSRAQATLSSDSNLEATEASQQTSRSSQPLLQESPERFEDTAEYARSQIRPDQPQDSAESVPVKQAPQPVNPAKPKAAAEAALDLPPLDPNALAAGTPNSAPVLARATPLPRPAGAAATLGGGQMGLDPHSNSHYENLAGITRYL